jgi:hypothetical protein
MWQKRIFFKSFFLIIFFSSKLSPFSFVFNVKCAMTNEILILQKKKGSRVLHSELLTELLSRFSSRDEFGRLGHYQNISEIRVPTRSDPNFCEFFAKIRVRTSFRKSGQVRKARTLPKYFRNSKKAYFRNSRKRKFRKKTSNAGP